MRKALTKLKADASKLKASMQAALSSAAQLETQISNDSRWWWARLGDKKDQVLTKLQCASAALTKDMSQWHRDFLMNVDKDMFKNGTVELLNYELKNFMALKSHTEKLHNTVDGVNKAHISQLALAAV